MARRGERGIGQEWIAEEDWDVKLEGRGMSVVHMLGHK